MNIMDYRGTIMIMDTARGLSSIGLGTYIHM